MDHTEKVLEEMLENLFAVSPIPESSIQNSEGNNFQQVSECDDNRDSPTNSFVEDVTEFFNLNKSRSNDNKDLMEFTNQSTIEDSEDQVDVHTSTCTLNNLQQLTIAEEIKRMRMEFPINNENCGKQMLRKPPGLSALPREKKYRNEESDDEVIQDMSSTDFTKNADNNAFLAEVRRVLYENRRENFPDYNTPEYNDVAQEYAIYGNDFLDFPQNDAIFNQVKLKRISKVPYEVTPSSSEEEIIQPTNLQSSISVTEFPNSGTTSETKIWHSESNQNASNCGNYTPKNLEQTTVEPLNFNSNSNNNSNMRRTVSDRPMMSNKQLSVAATAGAATAATYYQLCTNLQPALRPVTAANAAAAAAAAAVNATNSTYNMLLNNKVTYLANGAHSVPPQQVFYNQQQLSTTTKYYANHAAISNPANVRFPNPVVATTTTQQISNTVFKETQYVANMPVPNSAGMSNSNVFERLVYAQMLQQKIFQTRQHQQQQQQQQQQHHQPQHQPQLQHQHQHQHQHQQQQQHQQQAMVAAAMYQLQRQQQQMRIATNLQNTTLNVGGNVSGNIGGYTGGIESSNTMLPTQPVSNNAFPDNSGSYACSIHDQTFENNNVDPGNNPPDNHGMN